MFTRDCPGQDGSSGTFYGLAISEKYLLASCENYGDLLVYAAEHFGKQSPIEVVGRGLFGTPGDVKLGP